MHNEIMLGLKFRSSPIRQCKLHHATCRRFDTIPACDGQTDRQCQGRPMSKKTECLEALSEDRE